MPQESVGCVREHRGCCCIPSSPLREGSVLLTLSCVLSLASLAVAGNKPLLAAAGLEMSQGQQILMEEREQPREAPCQGCGCCRALTSVSSSTLQLPGSRDGRRPPTSPAPYSECLRVFSLEGLWECFWRRELLCEILGMLPHRDNSQLLPEVVVTNLIQASLAAFPPSPSSTAAGILAHRPLWDVSSTVFSGMGIC